MLVFNFSRCCSTCCYLHANHFSVGTSQVEIATSKDVGKDLEHVGMLQKKFDEFTNDLNASDARVEAVNKSALELIRQAHPDQTFIQQRQQVGFSAYFFFLILIKFSSSSTHTCAHKIRGEQPGGRHFCVCTQHTTQST